MRSWPLVAFASLCLACDPALPLSDDAGGHDGDAVGSDATTDGRADDDAGAPSCTTGAATSWDLDAGTWSRNFATRGIGGDSAGAFAIDLAWHADELYVAGVFFHAGGVPTANVAAWSLERGWRALGDGLPNNVVHRITVAPDGRTFASSRAWGPGSADRYLVHAYEAGTWTAIGEVDAEISDLAIDADGSLLVSGAFTLIDGVATTGLARWDGTSFEDVAFPRAAPRTILVDEHGVCVAGTDDLGVYAACRESGSVWVVHHLPPQLDPTPVISSMTRDTGGALILAGTIVAGEDPTVGGVLRYDGASWATLGEGFTPTRIAVVRAADGSIWATGQIEDGPGRPGPASNVMRFADGAWAPVGLGVLRTTTFSAVAGGPDIYLGGPFEAALDTSGAAIAVTSVVRWHESAWQALEQPGALALGIDHVTSVALGPSCEMLVAGGFFAAGEQDSPFVAMLPRGGPWRSATALRLETTPPFVAIGADGTAYAELRSDFGGPNGLMQLRDGAWEPIGELAEIRDIAFASDGTMYVAGRFEEGLLAWDGSTWTTVGSRAAAPVSAMLVHDDVVWIAEGGDDGFRLSRWDGAWSVAASGLEQAPQAMAWWMGTVVLGGRDELAHESSVVRLRETWFEPLFFEPREVVDVRDLEAIGRILIVTGSPFPGSSSVGFARWTDDGAHWHELGPFDGVVNEVIARDRALIFGGNFNSVAGIASVGLAELHAP